MKLLLFNVSLIVYTHRYNFLSEQKYGWNCLFDDVLLHVVNIYLYNLQFNKCIIFSKLIQLIYYKLVVTNKLPNTHTCKGKSSKENVIKMWAKAWLSIDYNNDRKCNYY